MKQEEVIRKIDELAKEKNERIAQLEKQLETERSLNNALESRAQSFEKQLEGFQKLKEALAVILPTGIANKSAETRNLTITESELQVNLKNADPIVKEVNVETGDGKVLWALHKAAKPISASEIQEILAEAGRLIKQTTLAPTLGGLVKEGWVIKEGLTKDTKYRLPSGVKYEKS